MNLQVLISKKGTKVVTAANLHRELQLANHHFAMNVKKWFNDVYEFRDGIRKPEAMRDFARRKITDNPIMDDYYISVELAKLITLSSKSKVKHKYAKWLLSLEAKVENAELLTHDQILAVVELSKTLGMVSCQEACERQHLKTYKRRNNDNPSNWWAHRTQVLGYSFDKVKEKIKKSGQSTKAKSHRKLLFETDKYEMVRTGVIDLFMALGKSDRYARNLGNLAKVFAKELNVDIFDDRGERTLFPANNVNVELVNQIKSMNTGGALAVWS